MTVRFNRIFLFLYGALFFVTPLLMYSRTSEIFEFNKLLFIYLITGFVASVWVARMIVAKKLLYRWNILVIPLLLFWISQLLSTIFSIDIHTSIFGYYGRFNGGLLSITSYLVLFLGFVSNIDVSSEKKIRSAIDILLKTSMASAFAVMLWGLPSHFGYDLTCYVFTGTLDVGCWTDQFVPTVRVFSTLGQPNWLATYLVVHILIASCYALREQSRLRQGMYIAFVLFAMVMLMWTRSRSALLGLVCGGIILDMYVLTHRKEYVTKKLAPVLLGLAAVIIVPFVLTGPNIQELTGSLFSEQTDSIDVSEPVSDETSTDSDSGQSDDAQSEETDEMDETSASQQQLNITDSADIRKIVWQGALDLGRENILFGTGVETFAYSYSFTRPAEHNATSEWDFVYNKAHNEILNYFATTGLLGVGTYLLVFGVVLFQLVGVWRGAYKKEDELLVVTLVGSHIALFTINVFGFSTTVTQLFYYMIPAYIVLLKSGKTMKGYKDHIDIDQDDSLKILPGALIAVFVLWFVVTYFRADVAYAQGNGLRLAQQYNESLEYLYKAYTIRSEHVYEDRISQVLAQKALIQSLSGENPPVCPDLDGEAASCIDLARAFNKISLDASPFNMFYYRTQARNNFLFFQSTLDEQFYEAALESVRKAQELGPTDPRMYYLEALIALGKIELTENPSSEDIETLRDIGLRSIEIAIELKDNYTEAYYLKGLIQKQLNDSTGAQQTFQYILDNIDPFYEPAKEELQ